MNRLALLVLICGLALVGGCLATAVSGTVCSTDSDCASGQLCVNGTCFSSRNSGQIPCTSDLDCGSGNVCAATGFCEAAGGGQSCNVTTDCPEDQYCNFNLQDRICTPLAEGACRTQDQCDSGLICSATVGGVGRCVECLSGSDCASGQCRPDGTCQSAAADAGVSDVVGSDRDAGVADTVRPDAGNCNPPCNTSAGEYCVVDVCYGSNGCPLHAHPVGTGGQCACDTGWVPNGNATACVPGSTSDAGVTDSGGADTAYDAAYDAGGYDSSVGGSCNPPCNTAAGEFCYEGVCYNADGCPLHSHVESDGWCYCDAGYVVNGSGDGCVPGGSDAGSGYDAGDDCPPNSHLESDGWCYCDDGYVVNSTGDGCVLDTGGGSGGVGASCGSDYDCDFSYDAFCATDWPSGYCSAYCYSSYDCGSGGECNCMDANCYEAYCFALCWSDYDCRSGYYCDFWTWSSLSGGGFCLPY
ncbi:MAG: hypothetical protein JXR83_17390 [Deltaproteobacteria bacterium]|nr:hypothetical protein [Deltaproteobacteria bacterium]